MVLPFPCRVASAAAHTRADEDERPEPCSAIDSKKDRIIERERERGDELLERFHAREMREEEEKIVSGAPVLPVDVSRDSYVYGTERSGTKCSATWGATM
jgi:hypothetical protein